VVIDAQGVPNVVLSTSTTVDDLVLGASGSLPTLSLFGPSLTLTVTGRVINGGLISFQDNVANDASITLSAGGGITVTPLGSIVAQGSATSDLPLLVADIDNQGTIWTQSQPLRIAPANAQHVNDGLLLASGGDITIDLDTGDSFRNHALMQIDAGRAISFLGSGFVVSEAGGAITGGGTLRLLGTPFMNDGVTYPGVGGTTSILTVEGNYTFGPSATLLVDIGGTTPGAYDQLLNTGNVTLAGSLLVTVTSFQPQDGDRFAAMTFAQRTGTFANVQLPFVPGIVLDTVWAEAGAIDTLYIEATASSGIPLGMVIGASGTNADDVDGAGNPVNLVGTAVNGGLTTLAVGASPPSVNFNNIGTLDLTNGFERSDLLAVRADQKHDASPLLLDLDNDVSFTDETPQPGFGMHAARFITFDLAVIRNTADLQPDQAFTLTGYAGPANFFPSTGMALMVLVDGSPDFLHLVGTGASTSIPISIPVSGSARYLTFAALEGIGLNEFGDHGGFAQVLLSY